VIPEKDSYAYLLAMLDEGRVICLITRIAVKNYRSLGEVDLKLGRLSVLVGPNGFGESNLVDVLRFVSDSPTEIGRVAIMGSAMNRLGSGPKAR
jgi:predicted ATPase